MWRSDSQVNIDDSPARNLRSRTALNKSNKSIESTLQEICERTLTPVKRRKKIEYPPQTPSPRKKLKNQEIPSQTPSPIKLRKNLESPSQTFSPNTVFSKLNELKISSPANKQKCAKSKSFKFLDSKTKNIGNLKIAAKKLHGSAIPNVLVSRDSEFQQIEQFIDSQLKSLNGGCLYVSGVPGSGKTATVTRVVRMLQKKNSSRLKLLEVNCMNISEPKQIYCHIHQALFRKKSSPINALETLTRHFSSTSEYKWPKLFLILDEMDLLWTRRQDVLYNMFDWPSQSSLAVIAISNTIDLPERLLSHRVASRLGPNRVSFKPYIFSELKCIVMQRVRDLEVFEEEAIEFASRKISSVSGDARSILSVCRRLIEARLLDLETNSVCRSGKIGIRDMDEIFAKIHNSSKISAIRNLSTIEKLALRSLVSAQRSLSADFVPIHAFYTRFVDACRTEGHQFGTSYTHFMNVVFSLSASSVITVEDTRNGSCKSVVSSNISFDDVLLALL